ncbi:LLM class flavin-dependent oxidoreductase [Streptosporangium sp. NBC_01755]|uniref:LLM class flavin-dependent oxidoreductase n=1 Tax=unclassified Streptosporangium TaxID=2632669 RepID=UPI002DD8A376|nr:MULTISPECIES: LLM class flavin-dependent oxidoreductase [unclassified Streptosporangium]WSA26305.1 LLM class flavin-dependent oxidoreductase [Streptosporangium sp. NBC_01810]WSD02267.1 LLM class flavin-dependent oxidoreductase [Streptosporangium sp. NBC_01755]
MARFNVTLPVRTAARRTLPTFVTDVRPARSDPAGRAGRAAELAGLSGALVPFDPEGQESLVVAAGLLRDSRHLRVIAEFHPGIATPVYLAKLSASLQRFSADRLGWWLTVDLNPAVARTEGDFLIGDSRYARAEEFLTVAKGVWQGDFEYRGRFYQVAGGGFAPPLSGRAFPTVYLGGASPRALKLSARHADVHVFSPGDDLEALTARLPGVAYGLRLPVLAREDDEALATARRTGFTGLTGSYAAVAAAIGEYVERGVSEFFLEAGPRPEENYRLGEYLLPLLKESTRVG